MAYDRNKVIQIALGEVGYHEKASNSQLDGETNSGSGNWTKYARDLDALGNFYNGAKNGYAWCDVFVDAMFVQAYGREAAQVLLCQPNNSAGAGCTYSLNYYRQAGRFSTEPQVGDQVFFGAVGNSQHTGLVVEVTPTQITTVEGNTSDGVYRRTYSRSDPKIAGYGHPAYESNFTGTVTVTPQTTVTPKVTVVTETCTIKLPVIKKGQFGNTVKMLQTLLIAQGFSCGVDGADGEAGNNTINAIKLFQAKNKLTADGEAGVNTWTKLLGE